MPPKRAATRRGGGGPKESTSHSEDFQTLLDLSPGIPLPSVPTQPSFNYGARGPAALPRRMAAVPKHMELSHVAESIDAGIEAAEQRDPTPPKKQEYGDPEVAMRARRATNSMSPVRQQPKRAPTPDQTQLLQSLRDATTSPIRNDDKPRRSTVTPEPPVPHTVSTDSSPAAQPPQFRRLSMVSNSPLYPSPLERAGSPPHDAPMSSPDRDSFLENASIVSWNLERDIHEDDLQRTRPSKYRGEPHGRNITKPPRRPSGLSLVQETIEEEEEPDSEIAEPEQIIEPEPQTWTAPARTIIPQFFRSGSVSQSPLPTSAKDDSAHQWPGSIQPESQDGQSFKPYQSNWVRAAVAALLLYLLLMASFRSNLLELIRSSLPFGETSLDNFTPSMPPSEIVHGLRSQVSRMNSQMSSLSRELNSVRSEHAHDPVPTRITDPIAMPRRPVYKVNFLSTSLGAIVDPDNTTPTAGSRHPFWKRVLVSILGLGPSLRGPLPPVAALTSWEDVGDCWCSTPRNNVSQISVLLGRDIVPEEVVVEHIPAGAALNPRVAPKEIELWARFRVVPLPEAPTGPSGSFSSRPSRPREPPSSHNEGLGGYNIPGQKSLDDVAMNALRGSNPFEEESDYSDDPILGPNFYRVGKWEYSIDKPDHVQTFTPNVVLDIPTIRVDKVVFRVTSNWGANTTCLYRLKLHGHL